MNMTVFNQDNDEWKTGKYSLFLGQAPGLYDNINVAHPKLFKYYKDQKSADWSEDEIDLEQSRIDMLTCKPEAREIMLENLALQWETDSFAARSIAPLFAPFVTNSEYWAALLKISEIEVLHALTYSEIVRVCMENPKDIFERIMKNDAIIGRLEAVSRAFNELKYAGAAYTLSLIAKEDAYPVVMRAVVALYCLERLQFVDSFAATFGVVEGEQCFQGIGKLVQKIMQDERFIHAEAGKYVIKHELSTDRGAAWFEKDKDIIRSMLDEVVQAEYKWNTYLFSNGRKCVGFTEQSGIDWIDYNAQEVYEVFGFEPPRKIEKNPLKYMENWLDLNKTQNANQEGDQANYRLNIIIDDLGDKIIEWSYR
jgi:ribonucleoside-diphosphate reductase beta chain